MHQQQQPKQKQQRQKQQQQQQQVYSMQVKLLPYCISHTHSIPLLLLPLLQLLLLRRALCSKGHGVCILSGCIQHNCSSSPIPSAALLMWGSSLKYSSSSSSKQVV
jgi:hypothetical protein